MVSGSPLQSHTFVNFQNAQVKVCKTDTEGDPIAAGASPWRTRQVTGADGCYTWTVTHPAPTPPPKKPAPAGPPTLPITHDFVVVSGSPLQSHTFVNFQNAQVKVCKTDTEGDPIAGWGVSLEDETGHRRGRLLHLDRHRTRHLHRRRRSPHRLDRDPAHHA